MSEQYENLSSDDARRIVDERLAAWGVTYAAHYAGERVKRDWGTDGKGQTVDAFRVVFGDWETDFFMGLGNRKMSEEQQRMSPAGLIRRAVPFQGLSYSPSSPYDRRILAQAKSMFSKPVKPSAADVLHCLLSDAEAASMSFGDWCDTFGADSDSIKALNTYQACERIGNELARVINRSRMAELRDILQNF